MDIGGCVDMALADPAFIKQALTDSRAKAKAAAEEGSRIHNAVEKSFEGRLTVGYEKHVDAVHKELNRIFPNVHDWVSEKTFAHQLGFGGACDLHSPSTGIIADIKTKDGDFSDGKKLAWDQHWQLAAYQIGLELADPDWIPNPPSNLHQGDPFNYGAAIFVSRTHPGCVSSHVWSADEMAMGWSTFEAALRLHKLLRGYDAGWV
jgi:hypothetical protein